MNKKYIKYIFFPLTSSGKWVSVFTYPYLSAGAPAPNEAKELINILILNLFPNKEYNP